ncbi:MAG TPA: phosphotriesterase [bacterium]|nr:phosphotriesterase [bacterium]
MNRREFLRKQLILTTGILSGTALLKAAGFHSSQTAVQDTEGRIMTVRGPVAPESLGIMLPHEHVFSQFGGGLVEDPEYGREVLSGRVAPYLRYIQALGCTAVADCTAAYFGRAPELLQHLSEQTGLHLITNTGYYGAAGDDYVPEHAYSESVRDLAQRWIREWEQGIGQTGIRPGFMKIGVDPGPLSDIDAKLIRAAAITHLHTGLTIAVHTGGSPEAAMDELAILREEGVHPSAWIWVHAHNVQEVDALSEAAGMGAWIEFDGLSADSLERHLVLVKAMRERGHLDRVLLSHDGNSFPGRGQAPRHYDVLFTTFMDLLASEGCSEQEIRQMTQENPGEAFTVGVREIS